VQPVDKIYRIRTARPLQKSGVQPADIKVKREIFDTQDKNKNDTLKRSVIKEHINGKTL